jgi:hypothetical protein
METILINIDSKYRDFSLYKNSTQFNLTLDNSYKNIVSIKMSSFEMCNNQIKYLNYNNISKSKNNNYFKVHIPNKLNDPEGTTLYVDDGINDINLLIDNISLKLNSLPNNEKYFYIFYLSLSSTITFDFNDKLVLQPGWYSLYGIVKIINKFVSGKNNFEILSFELNIFDRRFKDSNCIRTDVIPSSLSTNYKNIIYNTYIDDITNFNITLEGNGILDKLASGTYPNIISNSKYHISNNIIINNNKLLYNFVINTNLMHIMINNDFGNYYFSNNNTWDNINNLLDNSYLLSNNFLSITPLNKYTPIPTSNVLTQSQYNNYVPTLNKDIPTFEIDFNINNIYTSLGYYLGFRSLIPISSIYNNTIQYIKSQYMYNLFSENYIFLNLNNWGLFNFQNKFFLGKIVFNTNDYNNDIILVNNEYFFRQPINIKHLDISLLDYLGNNLDLNGIDFSFTIELKQVINMEDKYNYERNNNIVFRKN